MKLGEKIKTNRAELGFTQEELAEKLNVSRSCVANWESGRNYPDLQLIVSISDTLNVSLDELLREDCEVIKQITEDTKCRKKQSIKIRILSSILILILLTSGVFAWKLCAQRELWRPEQIISAERVGDSIRIQTDIPRYRSISGFMMEKGENRNTAQICIIMMYDFSMRNDEIYTIKLREGWEDIEILHFYHDGEVYKKIELK